MPRLPRTASRCRELGPGDLHAEPPERGCKVHEEAGSASFLPRRGLAARLQWTFVWLVSLLSLNKLSWRYDNLTFVIEK